MGTYLETSLHPGGGGGLDLSWQGGTWFGWVPLRAGHRGRDGIWALELGAGVGWEDSCF